jgi:NAD dependent epimerase/dehydratase family enzyme
MPAFAVRLIMGEMGEEFMLASRRMQPNKLLAAGYRFHFPDLGAALQHEKESMNVDFVSNPSKELQL